MGYKLKELKIEVTHNCPLSCVHCSSNAHDHNVLQMSLEKCLSIISESHLLGLERLAFSGGEPLVWDAIFDAIMFAKKLNIHTSVYTAGNLEDSELTFKRLSEFKLDSAIFSLYSDNSLTHNRVTRKINSFDNTISSIGYALKYGVAAEIHFVALASNYTALPSIADLAKKIGVEQISVLRFVPQGRGRLISERDTMSKAQNLELRKMISNLRNKGHNIRTGSPFNVLLLNEHPKCMAAQDRFIVSPSLKIYPCDAFKQIETTDIADTDDFSSLDKHSVKDCWQYSPYFNAVRRAIESPILIKCQECDKSRLCLSGCLAQKFLYHGTLSPNKDPQCLFSAGGNDHV